MYSSTSLETSSGHRTPRSRRSHECSRRPAARADSRTATLEVVALVIIAILLVAGILLSRSASVAAPDLSQRLKVRSGDSLWAVASSHPVDGLSTTQVVDLLAEANGLRGQALIPGEIILVPTTDLDSRLASR
jgi:Tfp pilus assembly protein FimV